MGNKDEIRVGDKIKGFVLRYISPVLAFGTECRYLTNDFCYCFADQTKSLTRK